MKLHYHLVDVFTTEAFGGNQLAVFLDADQIDEKLMPKLAREMNLSEITFVLSPQDEVNDFHVRIFTPQVELPMAGHPTIGTAFILHREGINTSPMLHFEEAIGVIPVTLEKQTDENILITMEQPIPQFGGIYENKQIVANMLSVSIEDIQTDFPIQVISSGVPFLYIPVQNLESIAKIQFRTDVWEQHFKDSESPHIFVFTPQTQYETSTVHSRMFAPAMGIPEDPATGAASGPLGAYLIHHNVIETSGDIHHIISEQGFEMKRPSFVHIEVQGIQNQLTSVKVGGYCRYMGAGYFEI